MINSKTLKNTFTLSILIILTLFILIKVHSETKLETSHNDLNLYYLKLANLSLGSFKDKTAIEKIYTELKQLKAKRTELKMPIITTQFFIINKLKDNERYLALFIEMYNIFKELKLNPLKYNSYLKSKLFAYPLLQEEKIIKNHKKRFQEIYKLIDIVLSKNIQLGSFHTDLIITKAKTVSLSKRTEYFNKEIQKYLDILGIDKIKNDMFDDTDKQIAQIKGYYQCNDEQSKNYLIDFQRSIAEMFFQLGFRERMQCKYAKSLPLLKEYLSVFGLVITKSDYESGLAHIICALSKLKEKKEIDPITSKEYKINKWLNEYFTKYDKKGSWYKSIQKIKDKHTK